MATREPYGGRERRFNQEERLARLETEMLNNRDWLVRLDGHVKHVELTVMENEKQTQAYRTLVLSKLNEIHIDLARYKGLIGGVILMASAIGAAFVYFKSWVLAKLGIPSS